MNLKAALNRQIMLYSVDIIGYNDIIKNAKHLHIGKTEKSMKKLIAPLLILILLFATGCTGENKENNKNEKPIIAVSIPPEAAFARAVAGDLVEVITMIPPGYSPENYEPTPQEIASFSEAALYFTVGVPAESASILSNVSDATKVVRLEEEVATKYADLAIDGGRDPHIWLSPRRAKVMVSAIARELSALDPANAEAYKANAEAYNAEIDAADAEVRATLEKVECRDFLVFHPAFGYFADEYKLNMYALEEEGKEATVTHLTEMIDFAKEKEIKVIFYQEEIDSSQSKAFAEEIGGVTVMLSPLSEDYVENLKLMAKTFADAQEK